MLEVLEELLHVIVQYGIIGFEFCGVAILIYGGVTSIIKYITNNNQTRLFLFKYMSYALNFKLGGEILKTVEAQTFKEIGLIACIFALRVAMTLLINYESSHLTKTHKDDVHIKSAKE